jgi:hypothetical protein
MATGSPCTSTYPRRFSKTIKCHGFPLISLEFLDGLELENLLEEEGIETKHYLIIDAHDTWWNDGKSYLCRIVDMLHMGYVDEVLFGREVIKKLPTIVRDWVTIANNRMNATDPPIITPTRTDP